MGFHIPTEVLIVAWTAVAAVVLLIGVFARLYRKAGPTRSWWCTDFAALAW